MSCRWLQLITQKAHKAPQLQVTTRYICKRPASKEVYFPVQKPVTAFCGLELDIRPWYFLFLSWKRIISIINFSTSWPISIFKQTLVNSVNELPKPLHVAFIFEILVYKRH